jgi:hypothetical protein
MTLRHLFQFVSFDSLVPYIKQSGQPNTVCLYKQAYDILLHIKPKEKGCYDIYVSLCEDYDGKKYINASQIEGNFWSTYIDGNIVLEEGIEVSNEELAFKLLWHLTYYGFSCEEIQSTFRSFRNDEYHDNKYGRKAREIEHKRYMLLANKAIRQRILASIKEHQTYGDNSFGLPEEDWNYIEWRKHHCNRSKRMRDNRLKLRLEELSNLDRCENTIQRLLDAQCSTGITRDDLSFLWRKERVGIEFQTRSYNVSERLTYLDELVSKYEAMNVVKDMDQAVLKVSTSKRFALSDIELSFLTNKVIQFLGNRNIQIIMSFDESLGEEIGVFVVGTKK